ncbi:unnamed protein product [Peniophora sp. CBMAI 1063]|nr:unnamed protein product [Peniophora sp. CBMAI 1063]
MERVRRVFECVASAKRPLTTAEVVEIYTLDTDLRSSDDMDIDDYETFMLERCTGLLNIVTRTSYDETVYGTVHFIHFSAKEFLMSPKVRSTESSAHCYRFDEYSANLALSKICLAALEVAPALSSILVYANDYWRDHVSHQNELDLGEYLGRFLQMDSSPFARWASTLPIWNPDRDDAAIHCAAALNLSHHLKKLLARSQFNQSSPVRSTLVAVRCPQGQTALHRAASAGTVDACRLLLERGALVDDADKYGHTPFHLSAQSGSFETIKMLLEHPRADAGDPGARIHARNKLGHTALHLAALSGKADACRLLLERGALVDDTGEDGDTPLHMSVDLFTSVDVMRMLLEHPRADAAESSDRIHARNKLGRTALHLAAGSSREPEACRLLLERGAHIDDVDKNGNTPSHFAAKYWSHSDTTRFLLEYRAEKNLGGLPRAHKLRNQLRRLAEGSEGELWRAILEDFASQIGAVEVSLAETWFVDV